MKHRSVFFLITTSCLFLALIQIGCQNEEQRNATKDSVAATPAQQVVEEPRIPVNTPDGEPARFAFRTGEVEMVYGGDFQGIRRMTFADYGMKQRQLDSAVPFSEKLSVVPPQRLAIITPQIHGVINLRDGEGEKMPNNAYQQYREAWRTSSRPFGEIALERTGIRLPDTVLMEKYLCRVYQQRGQTFIHTIWTWGGVPLRETVVSSDGNSASFTVDATSVTTDIPVNDSLFKFPYGYTLKEVPYGGGR